MSEVDPRECPQCGEINRILAGAGAWTCRHCGTYNEPPAYLPDVRRYAARLEAIGWTNAEAMQTVDGIRQQPGPLRAAYGPGATWHDAADRFVGLVEDEARDDDRHAAADWWG